MSKQTPSTAAQSREPLSVTGPTRWIEAPERHEPGEAASAAPWEVHRSRHWLQRLSPAFGALAAAIGVCVLIGWWAGLDRLTTVFPHLAAMRANTALGLVLCGVALVLLGRRDSSARRKWAGKTCAAAAALLGALTGLQFLAGADFGIDTLLVQNPGSGSGAPGRMAPGSAASFAMLGAALALIDVRNPPTRIAAEAATLITGAIGLATLVAYAYSTASEGGFESYTEIALHTAAAFIMLSAGLLFARPERGAMNRLTSASIGGSIVRRVLPLAVLGPAVLGWLTLVGEQVGLYSLQLGLALYGVVLICSLAVLTWLVGGIIDRADNDRRRADELHRLALYDDLSGLFNRRYLDHVLEEECRRAVRYGCGISCVMIDIDGFRQVNKRLGHPVGDWLIRQVAHVIRGLAREADIASRFGGDEFFLVLPETDQAGAIILSERLRDAVEDRRFGAGQLPDPITISLGVFTPTEVADIEPEALIRNAKAALRLAKAQGRNQILSA